MVYKSYFHLKVSGNEGGVNNSDHNPFNFLHVKSCVELHVLLVNFPTIAGHN